MNVLQSTKYTPHRLLNRVQELMGFESDAALANAIGIHRNAIYKVRARRIPIGASLMWKLHLLTGLPGKTLIELGGME